MAKFQGTITNPEQIPILSNRITELVVRLYLEGKIKVDIAECTDYKKEE